MELGVIIMLRPGNMDAEFKKLADRGFTTCQLNCWRPSVFSQEVADEVKAAAEKYNIKITAVWCGWSGPSVWDFYQGPHTLGLVPVAYRDIRVRELKRGSDFAKMLGVEDLITHVGFIPEVPQSTEYYQLLCSLKELATYVKNNGQYFLFETGQETPVTLRRVIDDIGTDNLGINLDPANLILYGKANPIDALDVFGEFVRGVHGKDGLYPTNGKDLGLETKVGEGKVNYPEFIKRLKEVGYTGAITIEREISGEQQDKDIMETKTYLEKLIKEA